MLAPDTALDKRQKSYTVLMARWGYAAVRQPALAFGITILPVPLASLLVNTCTLSQTTMGTKGKASQVLSRTPQERPPFRTVASLPTLATSALLGRAAALLGLLLPPQLLAQAAPAAVLVVFLRLVLLLLPLAGRLQPALAVKPKQALLAAPLALFLLYFAVAWLDLLGAAVPQPRPGSSFARQAFGSLLCCPMIEGFYG